MKKLWLYVMVLAMLLSAAVLCVSAELPNNSAFTPGQYGVEDPEAFAPVGDVPIQWDRDITQKIDLTDGDVSDWYEAGYARTDISPANMVAWVGDHTNLAGWGMTAWFVADPDYVYMAFDISDPTFTYSDPDSYYNGDAIQLAIDFGGLIGEILENDPDSLTSVKNIFYSIPCTGDGAPVRIMRQESDNDGWLTEANGDGVKGSARMTSKGWSVEFALSWVGLYDDYVWKAWLDNANIYVGGGENRPLKLDCCLYYLDRSETDGPVHWAAGTTNGIEDGAGTPCLSWSSYDNGLRLALSMEDDVYINCKNIIKITGLETMPPEECCTELPETCGPDIVYTDTVPPVEPPIEPMPPVEAETLAPDVTPVETEPATENELDAVMRKYGCSAFAWGGPAVWLLLAGVLCLRKGKDS